MSLLRAAAKHSTRGRKPERSEAPRVRLAGWCAALAVGVGGAYGAISIPFEKREARSEAAPVPARAEAWVDVGERTGQIEQFGPDGWVMLSVPRVFGGTRLRAVGRDSKLVVKAGPLTASAAMEAELTVSAMAQVPSLILESGHLLASSEIGSAVVYVPWSGVWLKGAKFGVLLSNGRLSVATLAQLEVTKPGHRPELFPPGQEIVIDLDALQPYVMDAALQLRTERAGRNRMALTSPAALVMVETAHGLDMIAPDPNGRALIPRRHRSLYAIDPLGRIASAVENRTHRRRRSVAASSDEMPIPLSIDLGGAALGQAAITKPDAALPKLSEESGLEKEMGELDEATRDLVRDF